jgi:hypothetical protein
MNIVNIFSFSLHTTKNVFYSYQIKTISPQSHRGTEDL